MRRVSSYAIAPFADKYAAKYAKAVVCLLKNQDALLTSYDFPAEHWDLGRNAWRAHLWTSSLKNS